MTIAWHRHQLHSMTAVFSIEEAMADVFGAWDHAMYLESYQSDSPGYVGPVAIVIWGEPGFVTVFCWSRQGKCYVCADAEAKKYCDRCYGETHEVDRG